MLRPSDINGLRQDLRNVRVWKSNKILLRGTFRKKWNLRKWVNASERYLRVQLAQDIRGHCHTWSLSSAWYTGATSSTAELLYLRMHQRMRKFIVGLQILTSNSSFIMSGRKTTFSRRNVRCFRGSRVWLQWKVRAVLKAVAYSGARLKQIQQAD